MNDGARSFLGCFADNDRPVSIKRAGVGDAAHIVNTERRAQRVGDVSRLLFHLGPGRKSNMMVVKWNGVARSLGPPRRVFWNLFARLQQSQACTVAGAHGY